MNLTNGPTDDHDFAEDIPPTADHEITPREAIVDLILAKALSSDERLRLAAGASTTLVLAVPGADWVRPVTEAVRELSSPGAFVLGRESLPKDRTDIRLVDRMMGGDPVVGISQSPERNLPPLLISGAERLVRVGPVDGSTLEQVFARFLEGPVPSRVMDLPIDRLGLDELSSLIVTGAGVDQTVQRIEKVLSRRTNVGRDAERLPRLEDAIEYGAARDWALDLRDDILAYRKGLIPWREVDRGCVLYGESGTGKTLLARMIGQACDIPTIVSSLGELFASSSGYLDAMIKAQRKLFDDARAMAPCLLFLDELNSAPDIDRLEGRNADYWRPLILDFYQLLDSALSDREGVVVIGATNRLMDINPAILRPGRMERAIHVGPPDATGIVHILRHHLDDDLEGADLGWLATIAHRQGATGAVLMEKVRAARRVARRAGRTVTLVELSAQFIGPETRSAEVLHRTAVHESGHALAAILLKTGELRSVSIMSEGVAGGATDVDGAIRGHHTIGEVENVVKAMLSGRVAEQVVIGSSSMGAGGDDGSDLAHATGVLTLAYASCGLGGSLVYRGDATTAVNLLTLDATLRAQVHTTLDRLHAEASELIKAHASTLKTLTDFLLERRFVTGAEVVDLVSATLPSPPIRMEAPGNRHPGKESTKPGVPE
jgi:cell division protease FtsH